jgi:hypothetical protein
MNVLSQETRPTERAKIVIDAIAILTAVRKTRRLSLTEQAALSALRRLDRCCRHIRGAVITHASLAAPVAIAHRASEEALCAR